MDMSKNENKALKVVFLKKVLVYLMLFIFSISIVFADAEDFAEAKKLIDAKTACSSLNEKQLEGIGDYLMEQMHPGEAHKVMDNMMGGEGSESLRLMHIAIAKRIYCNDVNDSIDYGMMGMIFGKGTNYWGMRNWMWGNNLRYGMMGNYSYWYWGFWKVFYTLFWIGLIVLIIWLIYRFIIKKEAVETPIGILRKRLASGKITKKQFGQVKKDIGE